MMEPLPGLWFHSIERHALPALVDGFIREYKKKWMESVCKHLQGYDTKLENTMRAVMKQLAATLSRQRGIQYEFGPKYKDYCEKKAAGTLEETHLKPLSEMFTEDKL